MEQLKTGAEKGKVLDRRNRAVKGFMTLNNRFIRSSIGQVLACILFPPFLFSYKSFPNIPTLSHSSPLQRLDGTCATVRRRQLAGLCLARRLDDAAVERDL